MAIADKLTELQATKTAIKTAIESKGQSLDGIPFTQYAEKITAIQGSGGETVRSIKKYLEAGGIFYNSPVVDYIPILEFNDTENVTTFWNLFNGCASAKYIPSLSTKSCKNFGYMFTGITGMTELPFLDTAKGTTFTGMFRNCKDLKVVGEYDVRNGTLLNVMFEYCTDIEEIWIKNIKSNLQVGLGTSYGHLLTVESLCHLIYELRNMNAARTLTVGSANLEKLANVYVRTVSITDEMRAEDDLIDEKLPFEVCESTDEGAMLITDYANAKNWNIAG